MERIAEYSGGKWSPVEDESGKGVAASVAASKRKGGFVWALLDDPEPERLKELAAALELNPLAVGDAMSGRQQPKVQAYEQHLFVVLWALRGNTQSGAVGITQLFLFARAGLLLVVRREAGKKPSDLTDVVTEAFEHVEPGVPGALYAIMSSVVAGYTEETDSVEDALEKLETEVFSDRGNENVKQIYRLRRQIGRIKRAISGLAASLEVSQEHLKNLNIGHEKVEPFFRDLIDDLVGTAQFIKDQDNALDGVLASHENNVAIRQNDDTRKISAIAALLSVPTVMAGIYGMNFKNLPGVRWEWGWLMVFVVIIVIDIVIYVLFKRRHWL